MINNNGYPYGPSPMSSYGLPSTNPYGSQQPISQVQNSYLGPGSTGNNQNLTINYNPPSATAQQPCYSAVPYAASSQAPSYCEPPAYPQYYMPPCQPQYCMPPEPPPQQPQQAQVPINVIINIINNLRSQQQSQSQQSCFGGGSSMMMMFLMMMVMKHLQGN